MGNSESSARGGAGSAPAGPPPALGDMTRFLDAYEDLPTLQGDLRRAGLESCNLILAVDFTKSNEWQGRETFNGRSLHDTSVPGLMNQYEQTIAILSQTLAPFDEDGLIPVYGFGCSNTHDSSVFSFNPDDRPCNGFMEVLARYRAVAPATTLAGPTSFGPVIRKAIEIVGQSGNQYHILIILADGQVTRSSDLPKGELSPQEADTIDAIVHASNLPLSIITVGMGDGPWDMMEEFDDNLPERNFDNFQFVPLVATLARAEAAVRRTAAGASRLRQAMESTFALHALMEVPGQYRAMNKLGLLGASSVRARRASAAVRRVRTLPPPAGAAAAPAMPPPGAGYSTYPVPTMPPAMAAAAAAAAPTGYPQKPAPAAHPIAAAMSEPAAPPAPVTNECVVCLERPKNTAFQCGHQTCEVCAPLVDKCPVCRMAIATRIRLY